MIRRRSDGRLFFTFSCHAHMGESSMLERFNAKSRVFLGDEMISNMNHFGIDAQVVFPVVATTTNYHDANEKILDAAKQHPTRLVPFARINPHFEETAAASVADWVDRGAVGLKFHPFHEGYAINDPVLVRPIMEEADRFGLVVLFHTGEAWTTLPTLVWDLAMDYKNVKFIIGHSGQFGFDAEAWAVTRRTDNLWLDTTQLAPPERVRTMVNLVGAEKVLFGTDAPYLNTASELEKLLRFSDLTDDELDAILGRNLADLLGLDVDEQAYAENTVEYPHDDPIFWS